VRSSIALGHGLWPVGLGHGLWPVGLGHGLWPVAGLDRDRLVAGERAPLVGLRLAPSGCRRLLGVMLSRVGDHSGVASGGYHRCRGGGQRIETALENRPAV